MNYQELCNEKERKLKRKEKRVWFLPGNLQHRILTTPDHDRTCTFKKIYSGSTLREVCVVFVSSAAIFFTIAEKLRSFHSMVGSLQGLVSRSSG